MDIGIYSQLHPGFGMRAYQLPPARAIATAVIQRSERDMTMVAVFSRQAGKDELLAQLLAYLLVRHSHIGGSIIVAAPTADPQARISRDRLVDRLLTNPISKGMTSTSGMTVRVGRARATFVSAGPTSNARGQTASILLVGNESQDIDPDRWDAVIAPMAASTNAPTLFMGTVWTATTLLARAMRHARSLQEEDGIQRLYLTAWRDVAASHPPYGVYVRNRIKELGESHPFIRTEYELKELDGEAGLFNPLRQQLMRGTHARRRDRMPGEMIALLIDVAGADEEAVEGAPGTSWDPAARRDSTVLTVVSIDTTDDRPRYTIIDRVAWTNVPWPTVQPAIVRLMVHWAPRHVIVDATGIGYGLHSWLTATVRSSAVTITPFIFSSASKSQLAWTLLGVIDSGRLQDYADDGDPLTQEYWAQISKTEYALQPGPGRLIKWGVPSSQGHDDTVLSMALIGALDELELRPRIARGS